MWLEQTSHVSRTALLLDEYIVLPQKAWNMMDKRDIVAWVSIVLPSVLRLNTRPLDMVLRRALTRVQLKQEAHTCEHL